MTTIALALRIRRRQIGIARKALARQLGIAPRTLGAWERGERSPLLKHAVAWAAALGATVAIRNRFNRAHMTSHQHLP